MYKERVAKGIIDPEHDSKLIDEMIKNPNPRAKYAVVAFLLGVLMVVVFGSVPSLRPSFMVDGMLHRVTMPETIEIVMMSVAATVIYSRWQRELPTSRRRTTLSTFTSTMLPRLRLSTTALATTGQQRLQTSNSAWR